MKNSLHFISLIVSNAFFSLMVVCPDSFAVSSVNLFSFVNVPSSSYIWRIRSPRVFGVPAALYMESARRPPSLFLSLSPSLSLSCKASLTSHLPHPLRPSLLPPSMLPQSTPGGGGPCTCLFAAAFPLAAANGLFPPIIILVIISSIGFPPPAVGIFTPKYFSPTCCSGSVHAGTSFRCAA